MCDLTTSVHDLAYRSKITKLEEEVGKLPQAILPVTHYQTDNGLYGRALFIPRGCVLTGKIHKHSHISTLIEGELSIMTERGVERITAPFVLVSQPGVKRAAYAHKDSIWLTVHKTENTEIDKIEEELVTNSYEEYLSYVATLRLGKD